jgi:hypothetical protein
VWAFTDSRVRHVDPWELREEASDLPEAILPAYIGSGKIGIGLDASGMQNLDCTLARITRYTNVPYEAKDDLYVFAEGMISSHICRSNLMPLGYLNYELTVDGSAVSLHDSVIRWQRTINIRTATVVTSLTLRQGIRLELTAFTPQETNLAYYRFSVQSTDGKTHSVLIRPQLGLVLRPRNRGGAILDRVTGRSQGGDSAAVSGEVRTDGPSASFENYKLSYQVHGPGAWATDSALGVQMTLTADSKPVSSEVVFSIGTRSPVSSFSEALSDHKSDWAGYYNSGATISIGDPTREFLFNNSLYLLRIGGTYNKGLPLEFLLFHPESWFGCTCWDLGFIIDGLIKTNHLEQPRRALKWLNAVAEPTGRPFHWLTRYNGADGMPKDWHDTNFVVSAAHAMSAIRYYETTHDRAFLKSTLYPILRKVSVYAAADRFVKEGDHYIGAGCAIDANSTLQVNDTFSTVWFAVVLKKTAGYAKTLGVDATEAAKWDDIADKIRPDTCDRGYKYCRSWGGPDGWVWMLLYPTEGMPLIDMKTFVKCREYLNYDNLGQPWCYFWQAASDYRTGMDLADSSERYIAEGVKLTYGPGYFAEGVPTAGRGLEGLPPYTTAHGSYLAAATEQLVISSVWNDEIGVFTNLPKTMLDRSIHFAKIRTSRGVVVSGEYSPNNASVTLSGTGDQIVHVRIPEALVSGGFAAKADRSISKTEVQGAIATLTVHLRRDKPATVTISAPVGK